MKISDLEQKMLEETSFNLSERLGEEYIIRPFETPSDYQAVINMAQEYLSDKNVLTVNQLTSFLTSRQNLGFVVESEGKIVAYAWGSKTVLTETAVDKNHRRKGLYSTLNKLYQIFQFERQEKGPVFLSGTNGPDQAIRTAKEKLGFTYVTGWDENPIRPRLGPNVFGYETTKKITKKDVSQYKSELGISS